MAARQAPGWYCRAGYVDMTARRAPGWYCRAGYDFGGGCGEGVGGTCVGHHTKSLTRCCRLGLMTDTGDGKLTYYDLYHPISGWGLCLFCCHGRQDIICFKSGHEYIEHPEESKEDWRRDLGNSWATQFSANTWVTPDHQNRDS